MDVVTAPNWKPKRIVAMVGGYLPGYKSGGPVRSIENLVAALGEKYQIQILTRDRDLGERHPYPGVRPNSRRRIGHADVLYLGPGLTGWLHTCRALMAVDPQEVLYLNSFFSPRFSILAIVLRNLGLCRPKCVVLAPRGEFSPGALRLKAWKKKLYLHLVRTLRLYRELVWQASSDLERQDILRQFPSAVAEITGPIPPKKNMSHPRTDHAFIAEASDIPKPADDEIPDNVKRPNSLRIVFISRISPKKNLLGALRMLEGLSGEVSFSIFGPLEDRKYWKACQDQIETLPHNVRAEYLGSVDHDGVRDIFANHDVFLFPTLGENFGHVIYEALSAGCPVVTSDQTPWRNLEAAGAGWDLPLDQVEKFRSVLQRCVFADERWFSELRTSSRLFANKTGVRATAIEENRKLFEIAFAWVTQG